MFVSLRKQIEHAEVVAKFFEGREDVSCQHLSRYQTIDIGHDFSNKSVEFDLSAVDPKFFIYEIARQAFEQGKQDPVFGQPGYGVGIQRLGLVLIAEHQHALPRHDRRFSFLRRASGQTSQCYDDAKYGV